MEVTMGWKGTLRAVNSEMNRQARESDKRQRQQLKEAEREQAYEVVQSQEEFLEEIISLHHDCRADMDWALIEGEPEPQEPINTQPLTQNATAKLDNFKPNIIHNALKIQNWSKRKLAEKVHNAKFLDEQNHASNMLEYEREKTEWGKQQGLAKRIKTDGKALLEVLQEYLDIEDLPIGKDVGFSISDDMQVDINLKVLPFDEVIPNEEYSLRQSGTLSTKKMSKGKGLELYQDHICSALIRVAMETLGVIPIDMVRANAVMNAVNTKTGYLEDQVIISALIPRDTLDQLNLSQIDPSDSLANFVHNMKFKKTKGFDVVEKVKLD